MLLVFWYIVHIAHNGLLLEGLTYWWYCKALYFLVTSISANSVSWNLCEFKWCTMNFITDDTMWKSVICKVCHCKVTHCDKFEKIRGSHLLNVPWCCTKKQSSYWTWSCLYKEEANSEPESTFCEQFCWHQSQLGDTHSFSRNTRRDLIFKDIQWLCDMQCWWLHDQDECFSRGDIKKHSLVSIRTEQ